MEKLQNCIKDPREVGYCENFLWLGGLKKRLATAELREEFVKGSYGQKQCLGQQLDSGAPHSKGRGLVIDSQWHALTQVAWSLSLIHI